MGSIEKRNLCFTKVIQNLNFESNPFILILVPLFLLGTAIGSFYFNLAYRVLDLYYSQNRKLYKGFQRWRELFITPSHCENCGSKIHSIHLIPILGYAFCKGKCPNCGYQIPLIYPIGEFLFGAMAVSCFLASGNLLLSFLVLAFTGHLLISIYTDSVYFSLDYENLIWILIWGSLINYTMTSELPGINEIWILVGFAGFFLLLYLFYPRGIGFGDVLFAPSFAYLSAHPWWMLFLNASYIPAVLITILIRKKYGQNIRNVPIPMGVYFCLGIFITFLFKFLYTYFNFIETQEIEIYE